MLRIIQRYPGTGIVYVRNRRKTRETAEFLQRHGISADYYHAGLDGKTRDRKQQEWMDGKTRIIVSTNAFGMGIDKPDVRFVIHIDIPDTLEGYFQEAGRGGRDLKPSIAVMLYDDSDVRELYRNFRTAFPPLEFIQHIYKDLCNQFHIAMGSGHDESYPLDIAEFALQHKYNPLEVYNAIRLIEKTGAISYDEGSYTPAKLLFTATRKELEAYEAEPRYARAVPFIHLLLRSYSGLFSDYVIIDEKEIARRAECTPQVAVERLNYLTRIGLVDYQPATSLPKLLFVTDRVDEKHLFYDPSVYFKRKEVAEKRLQSVVKFVKDDHICRSRLLLAYFGETESEACGKCDNCLKKENATVSRAEFQEITEAIRRVRRECGDIRDIVNRLPQFNEEKVVRVARELIDRGELQL